MLPPLHHESSVRGPSREALMQGSASTQLPSRPPRRVSVRKPPSATSPTSFASPRHVPMRPSSPPQSYERQPVQPNRVSAIEASTRVPREFFVVETNAVLPHIQYPPTQYQSTYLGGGAWETVVFPALTPHTRQQVLYLRQTLEKMRARVMPTTTSSAAGGTLEYTECEWALHSVCFHELARQIKFVCKEQSELLFEIQAAYDTSINRLVTLVKQLRDQIDRLNEEMLREDHRQQNLADPEERSSFASSQHHHTCTCKQLERSSSRLARKPRVDEEDVSDEDETEWREFQRQRLQWIKEFGAETDSDDEFVVGRLQRASIVEENTAAARVQQAFAKYQQRKEAQRALQRQEKKDAALDIQRSYRGYRDRRRTLHHRAVMHTILKRRKQVAAVELLQMNVRAYLIKKRREEKHNKDRDAESQSATAAAARESILLAQRVASASEQLDTERQEVEQGADVQLLCPKPDQTVDSYMQLLNGLTELAPAFSFLHSRRRITKQVQPISSPESNVGEMSSGSETNSGPETKDRSSMDQHNLSKLSIETMSNGTEAIAPIDESLLEQTIRQAEDLITSFQSVISELRGEKPNSFGLAKATSTTTLHSPSDDEDGGPWHSKQFLPETASPFVFFEDVDTCPREPRRSPRASSKSQMVKQDQGTIDEDDSGKLLSDDDDDNTHLDDVLWQASVYTPRTSDEIEDEASARDLLVRELLSSHDQQKRHAALKQLIVDIYDTVVGQLCELPCERLRKFVCVHASLALSFSDGKRYLKDRNRSRISRSFVTGSEYESVNAFVGRVDLNDLLNDHFHCQLGLKHLVDAAKERMMSDVRLFMGLDADIQRFHDYLMRERPMEDLVFFCLCRFFARNSKQTRQPVFHCQTMRELIDTKSALDIAQELFHVAGNDDSMVKTDGFVIEPSNEIYARHLPSAGLQQLDAILRDYTTPVDCGHDGLSSQGRCPYTRSSNINHFHAREYNASAARSPLMRRDRPDRLTSIPEASEDVGGKSWVYFVEFVDLLRRYRKAMRHFHAFIQWTYDLFHEAFRCQKQQQPAPLSNDTPSLLEEAVFVQTLLPYSLGAGERDLRNVFHNALKQRHLQRLMPVRVFVSVVLVLLRNGLLSVTSYKPLERRPTFGAASAPVHHELAPLATYRHRSLEQQWMRLALQWRAHEQRFEETIEKIYSAPRESHHTESAEPASQLLQWRNELYELFMSRGNREGVERAQQLYGMLVDAMARDSVAASTQEGQFMSDITSSGVGSPWSTDDGGA